VVVFTGVVLTSRSALFWAKCMGHREASVWELEESDASAASQSCGTLIGMAPTSTFPDWASQHSTEHGRRLAPVQTLVARLPQMGDKLLEAGALEPGGYIDWDALHERAYLSSTEALLARIAEGLWLGSTVDINFRTLATLDNEHFEVALDMLRAIRER
jgi:hypothetical protein